MPLPAIVHAVRRAAQLVLLAAALAAPLAAQSGKGPEKPFESPAFAAAVAKGTRTRTGAPGPAYWQQHARYTLSAEIVPLAKRLVGRAHVVYENRSPDSLRSVFVHLYGNLFTEDAKQNIDATTLGGVTLLSVAADGTVLDSTAKAQAPGYRVTGTVAELRLPHVLAPGASVALDFEWRLRVQPDGAPRGGQDGEVWFLSYWYPQVAVYDDVNGWQTDQYVGQGEFYMGYADYDVAITVPAGWLVQATGTLRNAEEVLRAPVRDRLAQARHSAAVVHVVSAAQRGADSATTAGTDGKLTWKFSATNVRDVAFATSAKYLWDAVATEVGDVDGDGRADTTLAQALFRPEAQRRTWGASAAYVRHAVNSYSRELWPYPYPAMTAVDGPLSCGGMEYPMLTCVGERSDSLGHYVVLAHEIAHQWFPMQVGSDEKRNAWQDEGLAQYLEAQALERYAPGEGRKDEAKSRSFYQQFQRFGKEVPILTPADRIGNPNAYAVAAYFKPAMLFGTLRGLLGAATWQQALRTYGARWTNRHPQAEDFFYAVSDVSQRDLAWFWRPWFAETGRLDMALDTVIVAGDSATIVVQNRGRVLMPLPIVVSRADSTTETISLPVQAWATDDKKQKLVVHGRSPLRRVQIDPDESLPFLSRTRLSWFK